MTRYTVAWVQSARNELAELWLDAMDRAAVTRASHTIDLVLAEDATNKGSELSEGLRVLFAPPLKVIFAVNKDDRIVEVLRVKRL